VNIQHYTTDLTMVVDYQGLLHHCTANSRSHRDPNCNKSSAGNVDTGPFKRIFEALRYVSDLGDIEVEVGLLGGQHNHKNGLEHIKLELGLLGGQHNHENGLSNKKMKLINIIMRMDCRTRR